MKKTELAIERCKTISTLQKILGGKWKIEILYYIAIRDIHRFGELRRHIGEITELIINQAATRIRSRRILIRHDYHEVPPRVEYTLTELGKSFISVLDFMKTWGDENLKDVP